MYIDVIPNSVCVVKAYGALPRDHTIDDARATEGLPFRLVLLTCFSTRRPICENVVQEITASASPVPYIPIASETKQCQSAPDTRILRSLLQKYRDIVIPCTYRTTICPYLSKLSIFSFNFSAILVSCESI